MPRGTGVGSSSVVLAFLLADLGVLTTHSRPCISTDSRYSESHFRTLKYRPEFPDRFENIQQVRALCRPPPPDRNPHIIRWIQARPNVAFQTCSVRKRLKRGREEVIATKIS
jgi:hypothetical protein